jgi:hypothetical protein
VNRAGMALLSDGRIILVGGVEMGYTVSLAQIVDPNTGETVRLQLPYGVYSPSVIATPDGRALVIGGYDESKTPMPMMQVYDPGVGSFDVVTMTTARADTTATLTASGQVVLFGGAGDPSAAIGAVDKIDVHGDVGTLESLGVSAPRRCHTATLLPDGRILIVGGLDDFGQPQTSAGLIEPSSYGS